MEVVLLESGSREPRTKVIKTMRDCGFLVYWEATGHGGTPGSM